MSPVVKERVTVSPHWIQFVIDNFLLMSVLPVSVMLLGIQDFPFRAFCFIPLLIIALYLIYKYMYINNLRYNITDEQLSIESGVVTKKISYIELYRIVDYDESRSMCQRIFGLKSITIYSGDRTNSELHINGIPAYINLVDIIRERVEINKRKKGVYEITNR